jgi:hypothetical protein
MSRCAGIGRNPAPRGNNAPADDDPASTGSIGGASGGAGPDAGKDDRRRLGRRRSVGVN